MLSSHWIKFFDRELLAHGLLVLGGRVEVTGAGGRFEFDFFTHDSCLPELDNTTCAKIGEYDNIGVKRAHVVTQLRPTGGNRRRL